MKYSYNQIMGLVKEVIQFEKKFNGYLICEYKDIEQFKKDLINLVKENNGISKLLNYYKLFLDAINYTKDKKKALDDLVLILQGYAY